VLMERMQSLGRQVSTLVHANKTISVDHEGGSLSHSSGFPEGVWALRSTTDPSSAEKPRTPSELKNPCIPTYRMRIM
jgi:hypothetical protein